MIYMGLIHNEPLNSYVYRKEFKETDSADYKEINEFLEPLKKDKEEMNSVWISNDKKINKKEVQNNYPAVVEEKLGSIKSISGGCFSYHRIMMSRTNIGIFDLNDKLNDCKRYGFGRSYSIYTDLKYTNGIPIENSLFMEYTLGIGFINQIYYYIKDADSYEKLQDYASVAGAETGIQQFFFRKKLTDVVWRFVKVSEKDKMNVESDYSYVGDVLDFAVEIVSEIFVNTCEKWWYVFLYYYREEDCKLILRLRPYLEREWDRYFDENGVCNSIYNEWVDYVGIHDWRNIYCVKSCFSYTSKLPYLLVKEMNYDKFVKKMFGKVVTIELFDYVNNTNVNLVVEQPINQIGIEIQQRAVKKMENSPLPQEEKVYQMYYYICNEEYKALREKEKEKFVDKPLRVREGIDSQRAYAYMHKLILEYSFNQMKMINKY